ncbi:E3 ubiquitin-protein ligase rnf168-like [Cimex lectularius]|uniref:RING-type E3 ubiquitin transferase n=1 Tax=Cimex lectularius TaxID=79782 RepID=A0A8I6S2F4_CIMLE|nr:E3 ubiquitin-protein ligase rnf168-like [Cimex lectularius]
MSNPVARRVLRKLDVQDVLCPICWEIYIEPVSLPCNHDVCLNCLQRTVEKNSLVCPICRKRIGTFLRLAKNLKKIVNQPFWEEVKSQFPNEIKKKQKGKDGLYHKKNIDHTPSTNPTKKSSIKLEFDELITKLAREDENKLSQQSSSENLPQKLQGEALPNEIKQVFVDEELEEYTQDDLLTEKMLCSPSTSSLSTDNQVPGRDSITSEFTHFTPICAVPRTPPKVMPNGEKQIIPIYQPKNLTSTFDGREPSKFQSLKNKMMLKVSSNNFTRTKPQAKCQSEIIMNKPDSNLTVYSSSNEQPEKIPYDLITKQSEVKDKIRQKQEDLSLSLELNVKWSRERNAIKRKHGYKLRSSKNKK